MAKTKISEYDVVAANNTDVDGINIAESCPPSGINNAIREVMAHLKDFQSGVSGDKLPIASGGTNAGTASDARTNLGLGALAVKSTVATADINDNAVTTAKITDSNITTAKIADSNVTTAKIADDAVTSAKIATNAVDATALNVSGNGTSGQVLSSDGDGSFSWTNSVSGSNSTNGYVTLGNGLIIQWGKVASGDPAIITVTLPITFPTACLNVQVTIAAETTRVNLHATGVIVSTSQIKVGRDDSSTNGSYWLAIGY
jgi:hypothetical protein